LKATGRVNESIRQGKSRGWPTTAKALGGVVHRLVPKLRGVGVEVTFDRHTGDGWPVRLSTIEVGKQPSPPSPRSAADPAVGDGGNGGDGRIPALTIDNDE